jgi:hypothetical protein
MTYEEIHNIYLHMSGKAEGIAEATGSADFPVLFANAILEYAKRPWQGLEAEDLAQIESDEFWQVGNHMAIAMAVEAKLKEKNHDL